MVKTNDTESKRKFGTKSQIFQVGKLDPFLVIYTATKDDLSSLGDLNHKKDTIWILLAALYYNRTVTLKPPKDCTGQDEVTVVVVKYDKVDDTTTTLSHSQEIDTAKLLIAKDDYFLDTERDTIVYR